MVQNLNFTCSTLISWWFFPLLAVFPPKPLLPGLPLGSPGGIDPCCGGRGGWRLGDVLVTSGDFSYGENGHICSWFTYLTWWFYFLDYFLENSNWLLIISLVAMGPESSWFLMINTYEQWSFSRAMLNNRRVIFYWDDIVRSWSIICIGDHC